VNNPSKTYNHRCEEQSDEAIWYSLCQKRRDCHGFLTEASQWQQGESSLRAISEAISSLEVFEIATLSFWEARDDSQGLLKNETARPPKAVSQ